MTLDYLKPENLKQTLDDLRARIKELENRVKYLEGKGNDGRK